MKYPKTRMRTLDDIQKWLNEVTKVSDVPITNDNMLSRLEQSSTLNELAMFVEYNILHDYLLHHKTLTVHDRQVQVIIKETPVRDVFRVTFDYL